jgi:hypothetical protein
VEKDWVSFGHKFSDRHGFEASDGTLSSERSPVFVQVCRHVCVCAAACIPATSLRVSVRVRVRLVRVRDPAVGGAMACALV